MEEQEAAWLAESWSGGRGLVPRGPRWLLGYAPADPADVERHTGKRPVSPGNVWRVDIGGRFLRSGGLVYPAGVPFPEDLARKTAVVSSEVWVYVETTTSRILGTHSWPEAVRKPVASMPEADFPPDAACHPDDAVERLEFKLRVPAHQEWEASSVVCLSRTNAIVFLVARIEPDPLNEMLLFEEGGLSLRESAQDRPDLGRSLRDHQPPFRRVRVGRSEGIGREQGRPLGPQTWPWPAELLWWESGIRFELKGFVPLAKLEEVARST